MLLGLLTQGTTHIPKSFIGLSSGQNPANAFVGDKRCATVPGHGNGAERNVTDKIYVCRNLPDPLQQKAFG